MPGRLGERLERRGFTLEPRRPAVGDPLPDCLADYSAIVVFGGPQSANDTHDYIRAELDLVGRAMAREVPLLGICLGAQLMARALGAQVGRHRDGAVRARLLSPAPDARRRGPAALAEPCLSLACGGGFDLPQGAQLLAAGDVFPNQAFRYGSSAYALQFHPEVTQAMMCRWTTVGAERLTHPGAQPAEAHHAGWSQYDPAVCRWLDGFLDAWIGLDGGPQRGGRDTNGARGRARLNVQRARRLRRRGAAVAAGDRAGKAEITLRTAMAIHGAASSPENGMGGGLGIQAPRLGLRLLQVGARPGFIHEEGDARQRLSGLAPPPVSGRLRPIEEHVGGGRRAHRARHHEVRALHAGAAGTGTARNKWKLQHHAHPTRSPSVSRACRCSAQFCSGPKQWPPN